MIMEPELLAAVTKSLEDYFGVEVTIQDVKFLSEPDRRNRVARLFLSANNYDIQSVIFKQSLSDKSQETTDADILARFARDFAGLKFLSRSDINHSIDGNCIYVFLWIENLIKTIIPIWESRILSFFTRRFPCF